MQIYSIIAQQALALVEYDAKLPDNLQWDEIGCLVKIVYSPFWLNLWMLSNSIGYIKIKYQEKLVC
jgi:hypothetical protein